MNDIPAEQNRTDNLRRLAAQRVLHSRSKALTAAQFIIGVAAVVAFAFGTDRWPNLKIYGAIWGILAALAEVVLNRWGKDLQNRAALAQELFDTTVLKLDWPVLKGKMPKADSVLRESVRYESKHGSLDNLKDWYPRVAGDVPLHLGRIICQYENCNWSEKLRRNYANALLLLLCCFIVTCVIWSALVHMAMDRFVLAVIAPLLPLVLFALRQFFEHGEAAITRERLKEAADELWAEAVKNKLPPKICTERSRQLQSEIFESRRNNGQVFNNIYNLLKSRYEQEMQWSAEAFVEEAKQRGF